MKEKISNSDLHQMMVDSANDAKLVSMEEFSIELTDDDESVVFVDELLSMWRDRIQDMDEKLIFTICNIYGAFLGERFRATVGELGTTMRSDPNAPSVCIRWNDKAFPFASICYQRLATAKDVSVSVYYQLAKAQA